MTRGVRFLAAVVSDAVVQFGADNVARMSAALAYYALFALAPILFVALSAASYAMGSAAAQAQLRDELDLLAGPTLAAEIERILRSFHTTGGPTATAIGLVALVFGGSGIFLELRESLNAILGHRGGRRTGLIRLLRNRTLAFAMVLCGAIVLLAGMAASIAVQGFLKDAAGLFPQKTILLGVGGTLLQLVLAAVCFVLLYRQLPRPKPAWREAWAGAAVAAFLFVGGEYAVSVIVARTAPVSAIHSAGAVFAVLLWVFYSAQIVYFGAEFAKAFGLRTGLRPYAPQV